MWIVKSKLQKMNFSSWLTSSKQIPSVTACSTVTHTEELPDGTAVTYTAPIQSKASEPKTHPEFVSYCTSLVQYYLQCFQEITTQFLEYLTYLTKYCSYLSVPILVSLEASIHKFYV